MERAIDRHLLEWKDSPSRKVLLVRGARQIGKTYSIRQLGKQFKYYIEVNFEEHPEIKSFFQRSLSPAPICEKLSIYFDTPIIPIEVKSGARGQMQSIRIFLTERNLPSGIRLSHQTHATKPPITTLPLYATTSLYN